MFHDDLAQRERGQVFLFSFFGGNSSKLIPCRNWG